MKILLRFYLTIISLFFSINLFSQNFISENKVWSIVTTGGMEHSWTKTSIYKFSGDTTIQKEQYKKLLESEDEQKKNWKLNSLWFEKNDSVFQYSTTTEKKILVYDFNIAENDSFLNIFNDSYIYVDSIRTKKWGIGMRKLIYLHSKESDLQTVWIKGVGQNGLITRSSEAGITGGNSSILCFHKDNQLLYSNPNYNDCFIKTGTSATLHKSKNEIDIFPNPATNKIQIQFHQIQDEYYTLDIISLKGELIHSTSCIGNIKTYVVNVNSFSPGVYLLRLKSGKNCYTKKIVVN